MLRSSQLASVDEAEGFQSMFFLNPATWLLSLLLSFVVVVVVLVVTLLLVVVVAAGNSCGRLKGLFCTGQVDLTVSINQTG